MEGNSGNSISFDQIDIGGVEINYYFICKRKLWFFTHNISMERSSDRVALGRLLHERSFQRASKEVLIDNTIRVDFVSNEKTIHEIKLSPKMEEAHRWQLLYYLYYLKKKGVEGLKGTMHFPKEKKKESFELSEDDERQIETILEDILRIQALDVPPKVEYMPVCKGCAYAELCWG